MKLSNRGGQNRGGYFLTREDRLEAITLLRWMALEVIGPTSHDFDVQSAWNRRRARNLTKLIAGTHKKCCGPCKQLLEVNEHNFHRHRGSALGFQRVCKRCSRGTVKTSRKRVLTRKKLLRDEMKLL